MIERVIVGICNAGCRKHETSDRNESKKASRASLSVVKAGIVLIADAFVRGAYLGIKAVGGISRRAMRIVRKICRFLYGAVHWCRSGIKAFIRRRAANTWWGKKLRHYRNFARRLWFKINEKGVTRLNVISICAFDSAPEECVIEKKVLKNSVAGEVYIPPCISADTGRIVRTEIPEMYIASVKNALIVGESNILLVGGCILNDIAGRDKNHRVDLRYGDLVEEYGDKAVVAEREITRRLKRGICLIQAGNYNYFHFLIETLSKLVLADEVEKYRHYPILVDAVVKKNKNFREALDKCNKYNHPVIWIKKDAHYLVEELIHPASAVMMPGNVMHRDMIREEDFKVSGWLLGKLQRRFLYDEGNGQNADGKSKIVISRKNTENSRLVNEKEVCSLLQRYGYGVAHPEDYSVREQAQIFSSADAVVAVSGAALANMIFCRPGATILCIIPSRHRFYLYSTMAKLLGLNFLTIDAKVKGRDAVYSGGDIFVADLGAIEAWVSGAVEKSGIRSIICTDNSLRFDARTKRHLSALAEISSEAAVLYKDVADKGYAADMPSVKHIYADFVPGKYPETPKFRKQLERYGVLERLGKVFPLIYFVDYYSERRVKSYAEYAERIVRGGRWRDIRNRISEEMADEESLGYIITFISKVLSACAEIEDMYADVIVCNDVDSLLCGIVMKNLYGTRVVYDVQDITCDISPGVFPQMYSNFLTAFEKEFIGDVDAVIGVGNYIVKWTKEHYKVSAPCIPVYSCHESDDNVAAKGCGEHDPIRLYYHGTAFPERNLESIVRALAKVDGYQLIFRSKMNGYLSKIRKLAQRIGVADRVSFLEAVPIDELLSASNRDGDIGIYATDCYTSVNWRSSFTNKFVEWLGAGLPVITSDGSDQAEFVRKYDCGYVLKGTDEEAIAETLEYVKRHRNELREKSERSLYVAKEIISWDKYKPVFTAVVQGDKPVIQEFSMEDSGWWQRAVQGIWEAQDRWNRFWGTTRVFFG